MTALIRILLLSILLAAAASESVYSSPRHDRLRNLGPYTMFEQIIYPAKQEEILTYISHDYCEGRECGTDAAAIVSKFIRDRFEDYGLEPYQGKSFYQPFLVDSTTRARNICGIIRSSTPSDEYLIITAHYDHIGKLHGTIYNGADNNASGVTALLNLADMFGTMNKAKMGPDKNIVFAALDAKERNMAGSRHFVSTLQIPKNKIITAINIDQIGTVIEPVHEKDTNFVIAIGEKTLRPEHRGKIGMCNRFYNIGLDIDYTFYGSRNFTELIYQLSDQITFHNAGIPALLFTSGFHRYTNKPTDDPNIISFPVLKKRTVLIFYLAMML